MKTVVYVGPNHENSSVHLVGRQVASLIEGASVISKVQDAAGADVVVLCVLADLEKLLTAKRYIGYKKLVIFFAQTAEEYAPGDIVKFLIHACSGVVDGIIVHSLWTYTLLEKEWVKWVSPKHLVEFRKRVQVCLWAVSDEFQFSLEGRSGQNFIVPFNRINYTDKNVSLHVELSKLASVQGANHLFIHGIKNDNEVPTIYHTVEQGTREDYLAYTRDRGVAICVSNSESFGIYYLELMAQGVVVLFLDKPWVRKLIPSYPYILDREKLEAAVTMACKPDKFKGMQHLLYLYASTDEFQNLRWPALQTRFPPIFKALTE